eukprot:401072_1
MSNCLSTLRTRDKSQSCFTQNQHALLQEAELKKPRETYTSSITISNRENREINAIYGERQRLTRLLEQEKSTPTVWEKERIWRQIIEIYEHLMNTVQGTIYCKKLLRLGFDDWTYDKLFYFAVCNYHDHMITKQKKIISSPQHKMSSCFDFKYEFLEYVQSRRNQNTNKHCELFSLINTIKYKVYHLVYGYINGFIQSKDIQELCLNYYISDIDNIDEMYDDKLLGFNHKGKAEIIEFILNVLSPNDNKSLILSLTNLIKLIHFIRIFRPDYTREARAGNYYNYSGVYLALLWYASQQLDMYSLLKNANTIADKYVFWKNDYNIAILTLCPLNIFSAPYTAEYPIKFDERKFILKLLSELLNANTDQYIQLYSKLSNFFIHTDPSDELLEKSDLFQFCLFNEKNIKYVRTLCGFISNYGSNIYSSVDIFKYLQTQLSINNLINAKIIWFWLSQELRYISENNDNKLVNDVFIKSFVLKILRAASRTINIEDHRIGCTTINTVQSLSLMFFHIGLDPQNIIKECSHYISFDFYLSYFILMLRKREYNAFAWKLLNAHLEQIQTEPEQYLYLEDLMRFIDSKTGLLQKSIISYIKILNKKLEGNIEESQTHLENATQVCWKINSLIYTSIMKANEMTHFSKLYTKMTKTRLIKDILNLFT